MLHKFIVIVWPFVLMGLLFVGSCSQQPQTALTIKEKTKLIEEIADTPSSWCGWDILHCENKSWSDHTQYESNMNSPTFHPLGNDEPFFLIDDSRNVSPEYAAQCMIQGMLHCTKANRTSIGFTIIDYQALEQELFQREDITNIALNHCEQFHEKDELLDWAYGFFSTYPGIAEDMWLLYPNFSVKWTGKINGVEYISHPQEKALNGDGLIHIQNISNQAENNMIDLFLLIRQDNKYRLQSVRGFFAEYDPDTAMFSEN